MNADDGWLFSWRVFVEKVARGIEEGGTEASLSSSMGGRRVHWAGRVREVKWGRGVAVDMESVSCPLANGFLVKGWYVFLNSTEEEMGKLKNLQLKAGDLIEFGADLSSTNTVFNAVCLTVFEGTRKIHINPSLRALEVTAVNGLQCDAASGDSI